MKTVRLAWISIFVLALGALAAYGQTASYGDGINATQTATLQGAVTSVGRTTTPSSVTLSAISVGGTTTTVTGLSDPKSGSVPTAGAQCSIASSSYTMIPYTLGWRCDITASGTATVTSYPMAGISLGSTTVSFYVYWKF